MRIKIFTAWVPSGELKAALLWRQSIVLRISKSGNAPDWKPLPSDFIFFVAPQIAK